MKTRRPLLAARRGAQGQKFARIPAKRRKSTRKTPHIRCCAKILEELRSAKSEVNSRLGGRLLGAARRKKRPEAERGRPEPEVERKWIRK